MPHAVPFTDKSRECFKSLQWGRRALKGSMREMEGKTVHSSVSLTRCTPTCSVPCSNPRCAKMSPCFAQAKITRGTPAYATQSTGHSTVRTRYFPGACLAAPDGLQPGLPQAFYVCFPPHLSVLDMQTKLGAASQKPSAKPGRTPKNQWFLSPEPAWLDH